MSNYKQKWQEFTEIRKRTALVNILVMDSDKYGTASANQNFNYHPKLNFNLKLNFNNNQKPNKKIVANDNYENIFILSLIKNA